tara:strand:- start:227 stop:616 length:390 start_codon:yes stop_codon:yes gene_type:complete
MTEKKENNTKINKKNLDNYLTTIKKYIFKLLELDTKLYFFIAPGIALLVGLLPVAPIYLYILGIYISLSAVILTYKFYKNKKDNLFAIIFAGIAIIYCPLLFLSLNVDQVDIALTLALFVLGHKRFKEE